MKQLSIMFLIFFNSLSANAFENRAGSESFWAWTWEDQLKPTITRSYDTKSLSLLATGGIVTVIARQYDEDVRRHNSNPDRRVFDRETADLGGYLGSGGPGILIAITQLVLDKDNGLAHSRALVLTAASHITLASLIQRQRPNERDYLSMPSGHASSAFATAASLAYAYGWKVGIPAYLTAGFIAASRVSENIHWTSDVVAAAALGIYWGRASALATKEREQAEPIVVPVITTDGALFTTIWEF